MFCRYCGKEIPEDSKVCQYCGNDLEARIVREDNFQESSEQPIHVIDPKVKNRLFTLLFILPILLIICCFFINYLSELSSYRIQISKNVASPTYTIYPTGYYTFGYILIALLAIAYLLPLYTSIKYRKINHYFNHALIYTIISIIINVIFYVFSISGFFSSIYFFFEGLFIIAITKAIKELADQSDNSKLSLQAKNDTYLYIGCTVFGVIFGLIGYLIMYIKYMILLSKAKKEL